MVVEWHGAQIRTQHASQPTIHHYTARATLHATQRATQHETQRMRHKKRLVASGDMSEVVCCALAINRDVSC